MAPSGMGSVSKTHFPEWLCAHRHQAPDDTTDLGTTQAQFIQADVGDHPLRIDHAILGQLVLDDPLHGLGGDPQSAGDILGRAADQRPEHELLEAVGVGRVFPLERRDDVLAVVAPRTAVEGSLVDPEAGLAPDVQIPNGLRGCLELDVSPILVPAPLAAAAFGQGPTDLEAVSILVAFIPGDLHAGRQVHFDRHVGHDVCPVGAERVDPQAVPETSGSQTGMITLEGSPAKYQENPRPRTLERKSRIIQPDYAG